MALLTKAIGIGLLGVLCHYLYYFLVKHGVGIRYNEHFPGHCKIIPGVKCGSEQIRVTKRNPGLAFITSGQKIFTKCNPDLVTGKIYTFDFNKPENGALELSIESSPPLTLEDFGPHGMDILENDDGSIDIYTVNHAKHVDSVEVFRYNPSLNTKKLKHMRTLRNDLFVCTNDLTLVGEDQFYLTNWVKYCHYPTVVPAVEFFLALDTGNIVYFDHGKSKVVANGPSFNGITQSLDKKLLLVAAGSTTYLHVYQKVNGGELKFLEKINVGHFPDNVFTDPLNGDFYAGIQKRTFRMLGAAKNKTTAAVPSSGVRVYQTADGRYVTEEIFHDNGRSLIQGVSTVAHYKARYLFGSVYDKLAYCDNNP